MSTKNLYCNRRSFHRALLGVAASSTLASSRVQAAAPTAFNSEAIERLMEGNARFVSGEVKHPHSTQQWRQRLTQGQSPFATILGCSDSRVPPEILFDQGFGDLFVIRVAGNIVDSDVAGSVEYGVDHLKTRVVLVLGHEGCGAVTAALQTKETRGAEPREIRNLVSKITPSLENVSSEGGLDIHLKKCVEANVRWSVLQLSRIPDLQKAVAEKRTSIVGGVYDLASGRIRILAER